MPRRNRRHGGRQRAKPRPDRYRYVRLALRASPRGEWIECACGCGTMLREYDSQGRRRIFINRHFMRAAIRNAARVA